MLPDRPAKPPKDSRNVLPRSPRRGPARPSNAAQENPCETSGKGFAAKCPGPDLAVQRQRSAPILSCDPLCAEVGPVAEIVDPAKRLDVSEDLGYALRVAALRLARPEGDAV